MPELTDLSVIRTLCEKYDFALSKGFGQNFIINPGLPPKIVDASGYEITFQIGGLSGGGNTDPSEEEVVFMNNGYPYGKNMTNSSITLVMDVTGEAATYQWQSATSKRGPFTDIEVLEMEGYVSDFNDMNYVETLKARMTDRLNFVFEKDVEDGGYNALPTQAKEALAKVIGEAHNLEVENSNN